MERDHGHNIDQGFISLAGHSWPPPQTRSSSSTSYSCGYCKREFRSPQGLGGHMNVHRWDRARLIHGQHRRLIPPSPPNNGRVIDLSHGTADDDGSPAAVTNKPDVVCHFTDSASSSTVARDFMVMKNFESLSSGVCSQHHDGKEDRLDLELRL